MIPVAIIHGVLAIACAIWLLVDAPAVGGEHPALKPFKFASSIALLLGTLALIAPAMTWSARTQSIITWTLCATMVIEMTAILTQAIRGQASHFNMGTTFDAVLWRAMLIAILVALGALIAFAVVAMRPLELSPLVALGVRVGLWMLLSVAVSGFVMGSRLSHSVGQGDLRVSHFFAIHAIQVLPGAALLLDRLPIDDNPRWLAFALIATAWTALVVGTLVQALAGRPPLRA